MRGVLAYGEAAPDAKQSKALTEKFFRRLQKGETFLDAWRVTNVDNRWSAIIHKDAVRDTLKDRKWLGNTPSKASVEDYLGFSTKVPDGQRLEKRSPPFGFQLFNAVKWNKNNERVWEEVTPDKLDLSSSQLWYSNTYRVKITAPGGAAILSARLTMIHNRAGYKPQIDFSSLFEWSAEDIAKDTNVAARGATVEVTVAKGKLMDSFEFIFGSRDEGALEKSKATPHHSYFWFHVELSLATSSSVLKHDFMTQGLSYS